MTRAADADRSPPPRRRRIAYRAATATALLALALLGARVFDRLRHPPTTFPVERPSSPPTLRADCVAKGEACVAEIGAAVPVCHRRSCSAESGVTTNAQGIVAAPERLYAVPKPAGVVRFLAFGGSTTGNGHPELMWPGILETLLDAAATSRDSGTTRFEVLNLGIPAAGSRDWVPLYEALGRRFEPDGVIFGEEVNDVGSCATFLAPVPGRGDAVQRDVVRAFLAGEAARADLAALSPWFARHADGFEEARAKKAARAALEAAQRALAPGKLAAHDETYEEQVARCLRSDRDPEPLPPSIFDDYADGFAYTRASYEALAALAERDGVRWIAISTAPHDFVSWRCPTSTCEPLLDLHDWRRYLTQLANPAVRSLARERDWILADLERALDDYGAGRNPFAIDLRRLLAPTERWLGRPLDEIVARTARGELGKRPFFAEWMHPSSEGQVIVAQTYFAALAPVVAELRAAR
ncbi:MAG: hypothetical protein IPK07_15205 [Deltaproteobacteria bacterium]|nr:hypothetical protein [Deltaproteobacteria bacterium]